MMIKPALDKVKKRDQRKMLDITQVSLSSADLRSVHFFVEKTGVVHQMAPLSDVISDRCTVEIDLLEATPDAVDAITTILVALATGGGERIPKVFIERGSESILGALPAKINKDVKYLVDHGVERMPAQLGMIL